MTVASKLIVNLGFAFKTQTRIALMNPLMIFIKIIKLR
ncbi:hypothetical protein EC2845650_1657 [Escherichia coli 2845650]|nr:hypothetical protein EC2845650_1657 [Escherichia coli 2845650]